MSDFDPAKHKIVAVNTDPHDVDHGQHYHLSLPDLVREVREVETTLPSDIEDRLKALEGKANETPPAPANLSTIETRLTKVENVSRETPSDQIQFIVKRLNAIEARQTELAARVDEIEARPHVSEEAIRQLGDAFNSKIQTQIEKHVNGAMGDVRSRLIKIERSTPITDSETPSGQVAKLAEAIKSFGAYVERVESDLEGRVSAVEQMCAEVSEHITETNLSTMKLSTRLYRALKALDHDEADAA